MRWLARICRTRAAGGAEPRDRGRDAGHQAMLPGIAGTNGPAGEGRTGRTPGGDSRRERVDHTARELTRRAVGCRPGPVAVGGGGPGCTCVRAWARRLV